jgi:co-chaperonin GroES (HSP10)
MPTKRNTSGLEPLGRAVLIKVQDPGVNKGLIAIPDSVRERSTVMEQRAEVIAVGPECWSDEQQPRAQPGDVVIVTKLAGYVTRGPADGELYRLVNDRDVFCKVTEESSNG